MVQTLHSCLIYMLLFLGFSSDLRQTIAMTTTAMMKTMAAVIDPTMSGSCSWSDFGGSAGGRKDKK